MPPKRANRNRVSSHKRLRESGDDLLDSFRDRLSGSTFRMLNEQLYTSPSSFAVQLLGNRKRFDEYHDGYRKQLAQWPTNPNAVVIKALQSDKRGRFLANTAKHIPGKIPPGWVVADMGCGDAAIHAAISPTNTVKSFDLAAANEHVTVSDIAHTPLESQSVDVVVFCLALMGTNYFEFLVEAHRVIKPKRLVKIVEVRSRIPDEERFAELVEGIGFKCDWYGVVDSYFIAFDFVRLPDTRMGHNKPVYDPEELLLPCLYKRR